MIDDQQASTLIEAFPHADPVMQDQMRPQIQEWHDAAQKRLDTERSAREAQLRPLFFDVETLGGRWSKDMQAQLGPFVTDANKARAQSANMAYLAHATEQPLEQVAPVYETLRDQFANENFNGAKDDLGFYTEIQKKFQARDDRAAYEATRKGDATSAAFLQAIDAGAPVYDSAYTDWQAKANTAKGYDPAQEDADFAQYRDTYQKAYEVARENRDLFAAAKSTLERSTKAINAGADLPFEAATRLMEAPPERRKAVLEMLSAYAAHNQPEDPQGAVRQIGMFFKNMGVSAMRGLDPLRVTNTSRMFTLLDAQKEIRELESEKDFMVNPDRPLGPKIAPGEIESADGSYTGTPWRLATPEERAQRLANAKKADSLIRLSMELDRVAKNELDPVKPVMTYMPDVVESGAFGLAGSLPGMVAAAIPGAGPVWVGNSFVNQAFERFTLDHPDIRGEDSYKMAVVVGGIQAVLERAQVQSTLGKLPWTKGIVDRLTDPTSSFWRSFLIKGAANVVEQNLQEGLQDITPAVVQQTASALSKDVPGVDWKKELGDWTGSRAETFFAVLPLALLGVGVSSLRESRAVARALTSPQAMMEAGIILEDAERIAAISNLAEKETAFRQAWRERTEESKAAGKKAADARVATEQAIANNPQAPHLEPVGNEIHMIEPDGTVSARFTSEDAAELAHRDRMNWENDGSAQAVRDLVAWYAAKDSSGKWEVLPNKQTLDMESQASPESVAEQMKLAGYVAGTSPADVRVYGSNTGEVRDGLYESVSKLYQGSTPADVVHERTHDQFKRELASGAISMEAAEAAARVYLGDKAPAQMSPTQLHEIVADMGVDYFMGNLRKIDTLPASVKGFFGRMGVFFKAAFQRAAAMLKLKRDGKLDADWEAFLARAVGVDSVVEQNRATARAAQEMAGQPAAPAAAVAPAAQTAQDPTDLSDPSDPTDLPSQPAPGAGTVPAPTPSFSLRPAAYAEQLAAQMDALKRNPTARITIYENAKRKLSALVAQIRTEAEAAPKDTRPNAEQIQAAKDTHAATLAQLDAEEAAATQAATTTQAKNGVRLGFASKRAAADRALAAALAQTTGQTQTRTRLIQSLAEYNAILSAFPAEVRGKVGGFVQLAEIKTDRGRAGFFKERLERLERELEKTLRKEYRGQLDRVLESYRPKREAGKKPKGKVGAEAQQILDTAEAAMTLDAAQIAAEVAKFDNLANDPNTSPEDAIKYSRIRDMLPLLGDIKNADSARLVSAIAAVKLVGSEGWARWKFQQLQIQENRKIARAALVQETGKTGVRAERVAAEAAAASIVGKSRSMLLNLSSFTEVLNYVFGEKSTTANEFLQRERAASNLREDTIENISREINDLFTQLAGGELKGEQLRYRLAQKSIDTKAGKFSELEALTAVLMWSQEDGRRHMTGPLDENGRPAGPWNYDQAFVDDLTQALSPEALKVLGWLRAQYDAEHAPLSALYQQRHGLPLPKHENYSPLSLTPQQTKGGEVVDPISGNMVTGSILTPGSLRTRSLTAVAEPDFKDALGVFLAHKKMMAHWAAYYDVALEMQSTLAHRDVTNAAKAKAGPEGAAVLRSWLDYFAQGGVRDAAAGLEVGKAMGRTLGRASQMALFGRVSTLMVQSTQLAAASVKMPVGSYVLRLSKLLSGNLNWGDAMRSEFIKRRITQAPAIVQQAMQSLGAAGSPNAIKSAARFAGRLISGADALFTAGTYAILLDYHRGTAADLGLTGAEADAFAHAEAARDTEAVAQPTRGANRSLAELTATHPIARLGWSFASEARQKIALTAWALGSGDVARAAKTGALTFIVGGLFTQILKNLWREMKGDDDEEKWSAKRLTLAAVTGPLNGIPGFSAITGDGGTLFAKGGRALRAIESLATDDQTPAQTLQAVNTILSAMGLFSDNAAALAALTNTATDAAKLLENVSGENSDKK